MKPIIPPEALQQHIAVLGKTGAGKTFAAKGIVERLLDDHRQVCTLDPTGAWWGLRLGSDGKSKGYDVVLLGGAHADIPLAERSGAAVARLVTEQHASVVIDTSGFTVGEYTRWFIDFAGTLYTTIRDPLHLVIDEAHYFMPQGKSPDVDAGRMLHAGNRLMSGGRSKGIRGLLITQRPAKLHKDSLTCADTLIAMRVIAPQDRQAIKDWIDGAGDPVKGKGVLDSLAALKRGEGWVWYPEGGHLERATFPKIGTYDSSATPKHGAKAGPKVREIKLDEVHAAMAEAVKEAEANDPKLLRRRIAELERLTKATRSSGPLDTKLSKASLAAEYTRGRAAGFEAGRLAEHKAIDPIMGKAAFLFARIDAAAKEGMEKCAPQLISPRPENPATGSSRPRPDVARSKGSEPGSAGRVSTGRQIDGPGASLPPAERKFLTALAQQGRLLTRNQVAIFAGYSTASGHVDNTLGALRSKGYIAGGRDGIGHTDEGLAALGSFDPLPTGEDLRAYWIRELEPAASKFLTVLCEVYPSAIERDELATRAGYSPQSGHVDNTLGRLRSLELATGGRASIKASENLFE